MPFAARAAVYGLTSGKPEVLSSRLAQWCFGLFAFMANDETRGDGSEFGPSADLMRTVTVDVMFHLCGRQRRLRLPMDVYYLQLEPVLQRLEREAGK